MIFVTVGTHEQPFNRLIQKVDELKKDGVITEDVIIQTGFSTYEPKYCQWSKLIPYQQMIKNVADARIVITHGGPASFIMPLQIGKTPIVVPRQHQFNEHVNDHQVEFARNVAKRMGTIIEVEDIETLGDVITNYDRIVAGMESLALPIRNMVNAMYAKDISKKIWTSLQRKKEAGYAVGNDAPYGYIRNPVTKRNEIDPEAAFYVQLIFQWELMGVPIFEIARRMTLLQVPTPREWHRKMVEGKEVLTCKKWGVTTIRHILENQTYVGDTINNKSTQKLFAGQDKRDLPKEQWYVAKNTHPAIIARDDFEKVQKILDKNRAAFHTVRAKSEQIRTEYQNDLAGMVFCADCGRPMEFERLPHGAEESKKVCYYICKARQADDKCIGHQITEKLLKALLMDQLHLFITQLSDRRKVVEELRKIEDVQNPVYRAKGEIMSLTDKVSQMAKKREQLYADYVAGVVDSEDYQLIREDYSRQYDGLRAALQEAENKKVQVEQQIEEYLNMTSHLEEHLDNFEFDIQLVKSLVQKIEVSADKRIRIVFGFRDVFTELGKESAET